jgi:tripeptide aminopeptidase
MGTAKIDSPLPIDRQRATDLVLRLMALPGASGQEGLVAQTVRDCLVEAGAPPAAIQTDSAHRRTPLDGQTGNLIFKLPGRIRGPRRLFSAHLDTVPICVGSQPKRHGNLVRSADPRTGLGADDRAGVAVILSTALALLESDVAHPPLTFCWFVQEEIGLQGSRCLSKSLLGGPKLAFNWDGGAPSKLTIGATGGYRMGLEVFGIASHAGGAPEQGVSAITIAALAIADLHRDGWLGDVRKGRRYGTSNVGVIQGGAATNVVTDRVSLQAEARSHDPKFRERIAREITRAFETAASQVHNIAGVTGSVSVQGRLDYEAFRLSPEEPCVQQAIAAVRACGGEPELAVANGGLDANWLIRHGIPTVSLGCGQRNQHMVDEALDLDDFHTACEIALHLARGNG